jgi:hypothetical protein
MNQYSAKAMRELFETLNVRNSNTFGLSVVIINYHTTDNIVELEINESDYYTYIRNGLRIPDTRKYHSRKLIREFQDLMFKVPFNKIPLYLGRLPETVAWRLRVGE